MSLLLDDMREEFARFLGADPAACFRMDAALAHVVTIAYQRGLEDGALDAAPQGTRAPEFDEHGLSASDKDWILASYEQLHEGKLGMHWLWAAIERLNAGDKEVQIIADFGYVPEKPPARGFRIIG